MQMPKLTNRTPGHCPRCKSHNVALEMNAYVGSTGLFHRGVCLDCNCHYEEWYKFVFSGYEKVRKDIGKESMGKCTLCGIINGHKKECSKFGEDKYAKD